MSHLNLLIPDFWQYPKENEAWKTSEVWFTNKKIGPNPLASFMSKISDDADLSQIYMNHSIRVTGTTYLTWKAFTPKQIMPVTGHKSLNSLAIYQKVSTDEKLCMAYAMSCYLQNTKNEGVPMRKEPTSTITLEKAAIQDKNECQTEERAVIPFHQQAMINEQNKNNNIQNQVVRYENEDPFADSDIPDFDLGATMDTIEKEN